MIHPCIKFGVFFILLSAQPVYADAVYTWKDEAGTLHLSKKKPPQEARQTHRLNYGTTSAPDSAPPAMPPEGKPDDSTWLKKAARAKLERNNADTARQMAEEAIEAANRLKKETDAFLEPWRNKRRIKQPVLQQIDDRIRAANAAIERAETLVKRYNEAEQTARQAEREAQKAQQALFEQYKQIMSN